jgi:hypothetical protein
MWTWIWIAILYVVGMGFFYWLGGIGAASKAIERWGHLVGKRSHNDAHAPNL